jgi:GNAT superfamily N-acetyltransferase
MDGASRVPRLARMERSPADRSTLEEMAAAVEADLVAHVARLHEPPIGEVFREDGAVWFITGRPSHDDNGILRAGLSENHPDETIERRLAPFKSRALPMMWWFFTPIGGLRSNIERALDAHGLTPASDRPGMGIALSVFHAPPLPQGVSTHRVHDEEMFAIWVEVVGRAFDSPDFATGPSTVANRALGFGDDAPFRHFLCRVDETWVGASTLSLGAGVAGLGNISTLPEWRGRGIGTAVAAAALTEAKGMGIGIGALSADEPGVPLYEKLGFVTVSRHLTYVGDFSGA